MLDFVLKICILLTATIYFFIYTNRKSDPFFSEDIQHLLPALLLNVGVLGEGVGEEGEGGGSGLEASEHEHHHLCDEVMLGHLDLLPSNVVHDLLVQVVLDDPVLPFICCIQYDVQKILPPFR